MNRTLHALLPALVLLAMLVQVNGEPTQADAQTPANHVAPAAQNLPLIQPKGPSEIPDHLEGAWRISICASKGHAWIRFEKIDSGEVHTLGRYDKGAGRRLDRQTGEVLVPAAAEKGLSWDHDLKYEWAVKRGRYVLLNTVADNPRIFRGRGNGFGYGPLANNCATFARDAWHHYTGEWYKLNPIDMPGDLAVAIWKRHPDVPIYERLNLTPPK